MKIILLNRKISSVVRSHIKFLFGSWVHWRFMTSVN